MAVVQDAVASVMGVLLKGSDAHFGGGACFFVRRGGGIVVASGRNPFHARSSLRRNGDTPEGGNVGMTLCDWVNGQEWNG